MRWCACVAIEKARCSLKSKVTSQIVSSSVCHSPTDIDTLTILLELICDVEIGIEKKNVVPLIFHTSHSIKDAMNS